jgi:hypothetical protein
LIVTELKSVLETTRKLKKDRRGIIRNIANTTVVNVKFLKYTLKEY